LGGEVTKRGEKGVEKQGDEGGGWVVRRGPNSTRRHVAKETKMRKGGLGFGQGGMGARKMKTMKGFAGEN